MLNMVKFKVDDFDHYFRLVSNQDVMSQITERAIPMKEAQSNYEKLISRNENQVIAGSYKIEDATTNEFIGLGHLSLKETEKDEAEMGYMLLPHHWGRGYGTEVARMLIDLATQTDIKKVTATIDPNNVASRRILINHQFVSEKIGKIDGLPGEILSRTL